jgi:hypothetical protein
MAMRLLWVRKVQRAQIWSHGERDAMCYGAQTPMYMSGLAAEERVVI